MPGLVLVQTGILTDCLLRLIRGYGQGGEIRLDGHVCWWVLAGALTESLWIGCFWDYKDGAALLAGGVLAAYLLCAWVTDVQTFEVYEFLHVIGLLVGIFLLAHSGRWAAAWRPLAVYALLQQTLFRRMYGRADGRIFTVCAIFEASFGAGLTQYLLHMAAAFGALAAVQGLRGNISARGNLKEKVAFVPYIAGTAWLFLR